MSEQSANYDYTAEDMLEALDEIERLCAKNNRSQSEIERLRVGIQNYLDGNCESSRYSRRRVVDHFRALLNPKDSTDDA